MNTFELPIPTVEELNAINERLREWKPLSVLSRPVHGWLVELRNEHGTWQEVWHEDRSWQWIKEWRFVKVVGWKTL